MTHVVLITPWLEEPDDDRAIAVRAHIAAYAGRGLRVHVIGPPGPSSRPAFECEAGVEVRRLDVQPCERPAAFAARALQHAVEIASERAVAAVASFDAPACERALLVARAARMFSCAVSIERIEATDGAASLRRGCYPSVASVVPLPRRCGPCFVMPTLRDPISRATVVAAFNRIRARLPSWSLACAAGGGKWMIASEDPCVRQDAEGIAGSVITIAAGSSPLDHVACQMLLDQGVPCLASEDTAPAARIPASLRDLLIYRDDGHDGGGSLADRMLSVAALSEAQRQAVSGQLTASRPAESEPSMFVAERLARWRGVKDDASDKLPVAWWRTIERSIAVGGTRLSEAAR